MKTKLELIKNYPVESLKNWGDYFGYPKSICEKMTDMTECDWQNSKIAVLDDFGFQMINCLLNVKKVPLQNIYFLASEEEENKVELMKKWYSNFVENEIYSIYNIDMTFDLIIANPPYSNSLYKKIIESIYPNCKQLCVLCPWDLITAANKGVATREALNNHVIKYEQTDAVIFGSPLKLVVGAFDFTKETGKDLLPYDPDSIDGKIVSKLQSYKHQLKDHVYWSQGITGAQKSNDISKSQAFVDKSYNRQVLHAISASRFPKKLLGEPGENWNISMWGIPDKVSYDLISVSTKSEDFIAVVMYVMKLVGDARDLCRKEVGYIPLFTKFEELKLTEEEIARIKSI